MLANLQNSLFAAGVLVLIGALILLFMYIFRREYMHRSKSLQQSRDDLANMMILLQTMRDLLDQQKLLARQLNASLDKKVTYIRESVDAATKDLDDLRAGIKQAAALAQRPPDTLRKEESRGPNGHGSGSPEPARKVPHLTVVERESDDDRDEERPSLQLLALPKTPPGEDDVIESWVGLDFSGDEPDPYAFEVPDSPPEAPEDAEAAREAFRALLNLEPRPAAEVIVPSVPKPEGVAHRGGNGKAMPPLHSRVYEYNDAGMTVAQISQEIGIGKGEVRLILSLRKNRSD